MTDYYVDDMVQHRCDDVKYCTSENVINFINIIMIIIVLIYIIVTSVVICEMLRLLKEVNEVLNKNSFYVTPEDVHSGESSMTDISSSSDEETLDIKNLCNMKCFNCKNYECDNPKCWRKGYDYNCSKYEPYVGDLQF